MDDPVHAPPETEIDRAFLRVQAGDQDAFASWMKLVEMPLRRMLRSYARAVDVEALFQEGMLRMWVLARRLHLEGRDASARYAWTLLRNLARAEVRRAGRWEWIPAETIEGDDRFSLQPDPTPDPGLARAIRECLEKLPSMMREAIEARVHLGSNLPDRTIAVWLGTTRDAFVKNVSRARQAMARCLGRRGISLQGITP